MIEDPFPVAYRLAVQAEVLLSIKEPVDPFEFPFDGVGVEVVGYVKILPVPLGQPARAGIAGAMDGAHDEIWFAADVLHDVNLAHVGPVALLRGVVVAVKVGAQHPEGGPQPVARGHFQPGLNTAVLKGLQALRQQPG